MLVGKRAGRARIHTGQCYRPRWCAKRVGAEGVLKTDALAANTIVIGRLQYWIAGDGKRVGALSFSKEKDEVGPLCACFSEQDRRSNGRGKRGPRDCERSLQNL